jgi:hypothetical protein
MLLPTEAQRAAGGVLIPGRPMMLAAGTALLLACVIAWLAARPGRP